MRSIFFCCLLLVALVVSSEGMPGRGRGNRGDHDDRDDQRNDGDRDDRRDDRDDRRNRNDHRGQRHGDYNCHDTPDPGMCMAAFIRWHYDSESGECREFTWGGCGGNGNKFSAKSVCERHCLQRSGRHGQPTQTPEDDSVDEIQSRRQTHRGSGEGGHRRQPSRGHRSRTTTPPPNPCDGRPMCMMFCENGFRKGQDGCDICQCN